MKGVEIIDETTCDCPRIIKDGLRYLNIMDWLSFIIWDDNENYHEFYNADKTELIFYDDLLIESYNDGYVTLLNLKNITQFTIRPEL